MILRGIDNYISQDEESSGESENSCEDKREDTYPCETDVFVIRSILNN